MTRPLTYYFVLNSPWSYLAARQLGGIRMRTGTELHLRPVLLAPILSATGGLLLRDRSPARLAYRLQEIARWSKWLGVPMHLQPTYFPADESLAVGVVLAALDAGLDALALTVALGKALWTDDQNIADGAVVARVLAETGLPASLLTEARAPQHAATLAANTEAAIKAQVFGVPSCVVGEEVFWGQDRLDFVERALTTGRD